MSPSLESRTPPSLASYGPAGLNHLVLWPWRLFLTRSADYRIFQDRTVPEILAEVFHLLVRLPVAGTVESPNVSVAAGVALFEGVRQRRR